MTPIEEDILSLQRNLYAHKVPSRGLKEESLKYKEAQYLYFRLRSIVARREVAENSFQSIVSMKMSGTSDNLPDGGGPDTLHETSPSPPWRNRGRTIPSLSVGPEQGVTVAAPSSLVFTARSRGDTMGVTRRAAAAPSSG